MDVIERGPWDLELEVTDVLGLPGCGWNYGPGFRIKWDGRHFPEGMCPFAWNAFSPWVWALRYGASNGALGYKDPNEMTLVCPDTRHMIVWRIARLREGQVWTAEPASQGPAMPAKRLRIEVVELPRGAGCERGYQIGDGWDYDGTIPEDLCPLAWKVLSLWLWPLRYGGSPGPMGWQQDEVAYNCPVAEHPVVFGVRPIEGLSPARCGA